jgi:hypothetical protein
MSFKQKIRQTTLVPQKHDVNVIRRRTPAFTTASAHTEFGALFEQIRAKLVERRRLHHFVGEYALYMMACGCRNARENHPGEGLYAANLDAPPLCPYTSAVPWMNVILNPRAAP